MRAALFTAIVISGCGNASTPTTPTAPSSVMSASFSNLSGANTIGVAMSSNNANCFDFVPIDNWSCSVTELPMGQGRVASIAFEAVPVAGADYALGGPEHATLSFKDPTTFGTASGDRLWQSVAGTGAIHIVAWDKTAQRISFSYYGSMQPLGSPATGTFDLVGDGNIGDVVEMGP